MSGRDGAQVAVSVIVLAWGSEPYLAGCVASVLADPDDSVELIVVDNGAEQAVSGLPSDPRLRVIVTGRNLGFSGGCNEGARHALGGTLVLLNSDARAEPGAVAALVSAVRDPAVGMASGSIRLADRPDLMNSAGNPVNFLGVVWAGAFGEPASLHDAPQDVPSASGAFLAIRREVWQQLGGFPAEYFAYHEDTELSLRCWQAGLRVVFEPSAVALHHYAFSRNPRKQYLLQRNRWLTVLTVYPRSVLLAVLPAMLAFDAALAGVAAAQGWFPQWLKAWGWLLSHPTLIARRRRAVLRHSTISATTFADLLSPVIEPAMIERPPGTGLLNRLLRCYWGLVRRMLARTV